MFFGSGVLKMGLKENTTFYLENSINLSLDHLGPRRSTSRYSQHNRGYFIHANN